MQLNRLHTPLEISKEIIPPSMEITLKLHLHHAVLCDRQCRSVKPIGFWLKNDRRPNSKRYLKIRNILKSIWKFFGMEIKAAKCWSARLHYRKPNKFFWQRPTMSWFSYAYWSICILKHPHNPDALSIGTMQHSVDTS